MICVHIFVRRIEGLGECNLPDFSSLESGTFLGPDHVAVAEESDRIFRSIATPRILGKPRRG